MKQPHGMHVYELK